MKAILNTKSNLFILLFLFVSMSSAQNLSTTEMLEFYPYGVGNSWSYYWIYFDYILNYSEAGFSNIAVLKDTTVNDTRYWVFKYDYRGCGSCPNYLERIDTTTGDVYRIENFQDEISKIDNLYAAVGDTIAISNNRDLLYCNKMVVLSMHDTVINDFQTTIREVIGLPSQIKLYFAKGIGFLGSGENYWIDSAVVNGTRFGDITDIKTDDEFVVKDFILYQNYPNPFNPATVICYSIPVAAPSNVEGQKHITLKIYDILGNEVAELVNEYMQSGNYEVEFNAANLACGIYFYRLTSGKFSITKKMVLLK